MVRPPEVSGYGKNGKNLNITITKDLYKDQRKEFKVNKIEAIVKSNGKEKSYLFK